MHVIFKHGDAREFRKVVEPADVAVFNGEVVHRVYSTFALARDIEWTTRQFVLEMRDDDEEGIGTYLEIHHESPAFVGDELLIRGVVDSLSDNELICTFEARVGERLIAHGRTGQKILKVDKLNAILNP